MTPKRPLIESKRTLFLKNRHILTPKHDSLESHLASKNIPFFAFLNLVVHVYSTKIRVAPLGFCHKYVAPKDALNLQNFLGFSMQIRKILKNTHN